MARKDVQFLFLKSFSYKIHSIWCHLTRISSIVEVSWTLALRYYPEALATIISETYGPNSVMEMRDKYPTDDWNQVGNSGIR
ncbi:hypothetical protein CHS0354_002346 [Potamilus streckersoni]|uniref:Uncharacterized protein n=1 Tax=Potamilus streckersoni TaxID=2493646 RepID=A0AAE0VZ22_9BIVA|nr:hypothetical protein CHS0354_002346 [Potamilus streckersoni]